MSIRYVRLKSSPHEVVCSNTAQVEPRGVMAISLKTKVLHPNLPTKPKEAT